jgi:hypothetical protein
MWIFINIMLHNTQKVGDIFLVRKIWINLMSEYAWLACSLVLKSGGNSQAFRKVAAFITYSCLDVFYLTSSKQKKIALPVEETN